MKVNGVLWNNRGSTFESIQICYVVSDETSDNLRNMLLIIFKRLVDYHATLMNHQVCIASRETRSFSDMLVGFLEHYHDISRECSVT